MAQLLVTQALDERDLLAKKISKKIKQASFMGVIQSNEEKVLNAGISREEFEKGAKAQWQQINDLIDQYQKLDAAIINSNANTWIEVSAGKFSIASAIALRARLREDDSRIDFERQLGEKLQDDYNESLRILSERNARVQATADRMREQIAGKDNKSKDDVSLDLVNSYVKQNSYEFVDALDARKTVDELVEKRDKLLQELDTKIKVSNATTMIEF